MKRTFDIDIDYLEKIIDMLKSYSDNGFDEDVTFLTALNKNLRNNFKNREKYFNCYDALKAEGDCFELIKPYYHYFRKFYRQNEDVVFYDTKNYCKVFLNDAECLNLARDFFYDLNDDFFSKQVEKFIKSANNHLKFINPSPYTEGQIVYIRSINEAFICVPNYSNFTKVTTLIHELQHAIDAFNNPNFHSFYLIREVASMFIELVACDEINNKLRMSKDNLKRHYEINKMMITDCDWAIAKNQLLYLFNNYDGDIKNIFTFLKKKGFNDKAIEYLCKYRMDDLCYYVISYLIAIELYEKYQVDRELALYALKKIIIEGDDDNFESILNSCGIHINENMNNYQEKLILELNKKNVLN